MIYQDLKAETAFNGGYDAVKRYVRSVRPVRGIGRVVSGDICRGKNREVYFVADVCQRCGRSVSI